MDISDCLVTPQESHNLEKPGNDSYETSEKFKFLFKVFSVVLQCEWLAYQAWFLYSCQSNQPKGGETGNLGNLKCLDCHLEATKPMLTPSVIT